VSNELQDTWNARELPVLVEVARQFSHAGTVPSTEAVMERTGLSTADVRLAVQALREAGNLQSPTNFGRIFGGVTERACREVGLWPTPETALDRMVAALQHLATAGPTDDDRSRAREILERLTGASKTVAIGVATAAINGQMPT
jgi:hypothetical protein